MNYVDILKEKRDKRKSTILLLGGTGFLGSHLATELLKIGYKIIFLVRKKNNENAHKRINNILDWFRLENKADLSFEVIEAEISEKKFGLDSKAYEYLRKSCDEIINCAAETSFDDQSSEIIKKINILSLINILEYAKNSNVLFYHHLSTAFCAGKKNGICYEELHITEEYFNDYEKSKNEAEKIAYDYCSGNNIKINIIRPSIVCGNSKNGRTFRFNALYYPIKTLLLLKKIFYKNNAIENNEIGIKRLADNKIYIPLRIEKNSDGAVNIIPVDYFVTAFMAIFNESINGGVYHIVNEQYIKVEEIVEYTKRLLNIEGIEVCDPKEFSEKPKNSIEIMYEKLTNMYLPYFFDLRRFDATNTNKILSKYNIKCPEFDYNLFEKIINYAIKTNWGKLNI